jgi:Leu/Phe-tRNA-protein transferase
VLDVMNRRNRSRLISMFAAAERADRAAFELIDLLAGQRHAATVGAMELGCQACGVPFPQQPDLQFRLSK